MKRALALLLAAGVTAGCLAGCSFGEKPGNPTPTASRASTWTDTFPATEGREMDPMLACSVNNEIVAHLEQMTGEVTYDDITYLKETISYLGQFRIHTRAETQYMAKIEALFNALYHLYSGNCEAPTVEAALAACYEAYGALPSDMRGVMLPLNDEATRAVIANVTAFAEQQIH